MPTFELEANGKKYEIEAPDQASALAAIQGAQTPQKQGGSSVLPLSMDANGRPQLDWNEGIIGSLKRAFMLPGDVLTGKVDPNSEEGRQRALEMGSVVSPAPAAMRAGEYAVPGAMRALRAEKPKPPTAEALKTAAEKGYSQARDLGVEYSAGAVQGLARGAQQALEQEGILAELSPKTFLILKKLQDAPPDSVATLSGIDAARKALGHAAGDFANPTEQLAAKRVIDQLDQFMSAADPEAVVAGPASAAGKLIEDARGNYGAAKRSEKLTNIEESAGLRADSANSGLNADNTIRQRLRPLVDPTQPKNGRGYSPEELAAIEQVVRGSLGANMARKTGNLLGGGGGLGQALTAAGGATIGSMAGGAPGAVAGSLAAPAAGQIARQIAGMLTQRGVRTADDMVRSRSPLYAEMLRNPNMTPANPEGNASIVRALMAMALQDQQ